MNFERYYLHSSECLDVFGIGAAVAGISGAVTEGVVAEKNIQSQRETNEFNLQATRETNAANVDIAEKTNAANKEINDKNNAFNAAQADLAYERTRTDSQLSQLVAAGYSLQQAKQILAGSSSNTAAATPASAAAASPMVAPTLQAPQKSAEMYDAPRLSAAVSNAVGALASSFQDALASPTGGALGALQASPAISQFDKIATALQPSAYKDYYSFQKAVQSSTDSQVIAFRESPAFADMNKSLFGRRAFISYIREFYQSSMDNLHREAMQDYEKSNAGLQNDLLAAKIAVENEQELALKWSNQVAELKSMFTSQNWDSITTNMHNQLVTACQQSATEMTLWTDPSYRANWLWTQRSNKATEAYLGAWAELVTRKSYDMIDASPDMQEAAALLYAFDQMGVGFSPIGQGMIWCVENDLAATMENALKWCSDNGFSGRECFKVQKEWLKEAAAAQAEAAGNATNIQYEQQKGTEWKRVGQDVVKGVAGTLVNAGGAYLGAKVGKGSMQGEPSKGQMQYIFSPPVGTSDYYMYMNE